MGQCISCHELEKTVHERLALQNQTNIMMTQSISDLTKTVTTLSISVEQIIAIMGRCGSIDEEPCSVE